MSIENTPEFQERLARARARADRMISLSEDLRKQYPGKPDAWYTFNASFLIQLENQNVNAATQRRSWLSRLFG